MSKSKRGLAAGLVIVAIGVPAAAQARVMKDPAAYPTPAPAPAPPSPQSAGFQWDDAGIGAAGTVLLLGGGVLAAGAARRRRTAIA